LTGQGIALVCLGALAMASLVFHQLLRHRLYVGYAVGWLIVILGVLCVAVIPPLTRLASRVAETFFPSFSLVIITLGFIGLILIYFSIQLSILSERVARIAQSLAIANVENGRGNRALSTEAKDS
jgi:hypothetical protein